MGEGQAQTIADRLLIEENSKRYRINFSMPYEYLNLEAGDIISVDHNGELHLKIESLYLNDDYSITLECCSYSNIRQYIDHTETREALYKDYGTLLLEVIDIPTNSIKPQIMVAACTTGESWKSVELAYSHQESACYTPLSLLSTQATMGHIVSEVDQTHPLLIDKHNKIIVSIISGELYSLAFDGDDKQNIAIIGNEVIQFQNAIQVGPNLYELSIITRALKGSKCTYHSTGERFILLDEDIITVDLQQDMVERQVYLKAEIDNEISTTKAIYIYGNSNRKLPPFVLENQVVDRDYKYHFDSSVVITNSEPRFLVLEKSGSTSVESNISNFTDIERIYSIDDNGLKGCYA